jgi:hypothetical protein
MLDARGSKNSKYDSVFHWIAWTSSGQKKDHEGYYVYCDNRAGTLAYIFEAVVFVVGTVWYICSIDADEAGRRCTAAVANPMRLTSIGAQPRSLGSHVGASCFTPRA